MHSFNNSLWDSKIEMCFLRRNPWKNTERIPWGIPEKSLRQTSDKKSLRIRKRNFWRESRRIPKKISKESHGSQKKCLKGFQKELMRIIRKIFRNFFNFSLWGFSYKLLHVLHHRLNFIVRQFESSRRVNPFKIGIALLSNFWYHSSVGDSAAVRKIRGVFLVSRILGSCGDVYNVWSLFS